MKYEAKIIEWIADEMCNYEVLTDEEFIAWLVEAYEITQREAEFIMDTRDQFLRTAIMSEEDAFEIVANAIERANAEEELMEGHAQQGNNNTSKMKITKQNYFEQYGKLDKKGIPEAFTQAHKLLSGLTENGASWSKVKPDSSVAKMAEKQFKFLEMLLEKQGVKPEKQKGNKTKPATHPKEQKTVKQSKSKEPKDRTATEAARTVKKTAGRISAGEPVETVDPHLVILARYKRMDGKTVPRDKVTALARTLVKQIEARILRRASSYSALIDKMKKHLFDLLDTSKGVNIRVQLNGSTREAIDTALNEQHQMKSVQLLRRYSGMAGKHTTVDKAKRLYNGMVSAVENESVPQDDRYFERVIEIMRFLKKYVEKADERKQMPLLPAELSGILGDVDSDEDSGWGDHSLDGVAGDDSDEASFDDNTDDSETEDSQSELKEPICSTEFMHQKFARYPIGEPWVKIFGQIEPGKHTIVFSKEKLGKTTAMVDFAGYLSKQYGPVLFVQKEEGLSGTFQDKLETTRAANQNLFLKEDLPSIEELKQYRFVFLDSVSRLNLSPKQLVNLQKKLGKLTTLIAILHATKQGTHRGSNDYAHDAFQIVTFPEYGAAYGHGRFKGTTGELVRFTDPKQ